LQNRDSKIPIGFEDDASYFGILAPLIQRLFPVPSGIKRVPLGENFSFITTLLLLGDSSLSLFSLWNPSFLTLLAEYMVAHKDILIKSLFDGRILWPLENPILVE
jgi:hypothetical protein